MNPGKKNDGCARYFAASQRGRVGLFPPGAGKAEIEKRGPINDPKEYVAAGF